MPKRDSYCNGNTSFNGPLSIRDLTLIVDIKGFELHHYFNPFETGIQHFRFLEITAHGSEGENDTVCVNGDWCGRTANRFQRRIESRPDAGFAAQSSPFEEPGGRCDYSMKRTFTCWSGSAFRPDNIDTAWGHTALRSVGIPATYYLLSLVRFDPFLHALFLLLPPIPCESVNTCMCSNVESMFYKRFSSGNYGIYIHVHSHHDDNLKSFENNTSPLYSTQ